MRDDIIINAASDISHAMAQMAGEAGEVLNQMQHGDRIDIFDIQATFPKSGKKDGDTDSASVSAFAEAQLAAIPDTQERCRQNWTHIADFSIHPATPICSITGTLYIHARITADNRLQFGIFQAPVSGTAMDQVPLAIVGDTSVDQMRHYPNFHDFRIAGKDDAESFMLQNGKVKRSTLPRLAGIWMMRGQAKVNMHKRAATAQDAARTFSKLIRYYGHIWSYWYTVHDNTLYFVGVPIWTGNDTGTIVQTSRVIVNKAAQTRQHINTRTPVNLPPTEDDIDNRALFVIGGNVSGIPATTAAMQQFKTAFGKTWKSGSIAGSDADAFKTDSLIEECTIADAATPAQTSHAIAQIFEGDGKFFLRQIAHGAIDAEITALGYNGGIVFDGGQLTPYQFTDGANYAIDDCAGDTCTSSHGLSAFLPVAIRLTSEGMCKPAIFSIWARRYGKGLELRMMQPRQTGNTFTRTSADAVLWMDYETIGGDIEDDDIDDDTGDDGDEDDDDDDDINPPSSFVDLGDLGFWYTGTGAARVSATRDRASGDTLRYLYTVTIHAQISITKNLIFQIQARFSTADGGDYTYRDVPVSMWYYLESDGGNPVLRNLTSMNFGYKPPQANKHPTSADIFQKTVTRNANISASFSTVYADSDTRLQDGNIVSIIDTGRTKRVSGNIRQPGANRGTPARGTLRILEVRVNPAIVRQCLEYYIAKHAAEEAVTIIPPQITGSTNGSQAGDPSISVLPSTAINDTAATPTPNNIPTGEFDLYASGTITDASANYRITNGCTAWNEDNGSGIIRRYSVNISGTFSASVPATRIQDAIVPRS